MANPAPDSGYRPGSEIFLEQFYSFIQQLGRLHCPFRFPRGVLCASSLMAIFHGLQAFSMRARCKKYVFFFSHVFLRLCFACQNPITLALFVRLTVCTDFAGDVGVIETNFVNNKL